MVLGGSSASGGTASIGNADADRMISRRVESVMRRPVEQRGMALASFANPFGVTRTGALSLQL